MSAVALVTIGYVNTSGQKKTAKANSVFDDYDPDRFSEWEAQGWVRKATIGEIAEAEAEAGADTPKTPKTPKTPEVAGKTRKPRQPKAEKPAESEGGKKPEDEDLA